MSTEVENKDFLENENIYSLSIGGKVGEASDPQQQKKVNLHNVSYSLDRQKAYDIAHSILELQEKPIIKLHRVETYEKH